MRLDFVFYLHNNSRKKQTVGFIFIIFLIVYRHIDIGSYTGEEVRNLKMFNQICQDTARFMFNDQIEYPG